MKMACVFPGQGSQQVGMLKDFYEAHTVVKDTFSEAGEVLGYDLWALIQNGPQEELNMTEVAQPALLCSSLALWRLWQQQGGAQPELLAGHSLGEWSALVAADALNFDDAVRLVRLRGKYMQEAVPAGQGIMAAILGLEDQVVENVCAEASKRGVVVPVNYNSPGQLVIAGEVAAVEFALARCQENGAKRALRLPVSAPFHTPLMKSAAERLAEDMDQVDFREPAIPLVHNVTGGVNPDRLRIPSLMLEQIYSAVKWVDCVSCLAASEVTHILECGPGKVLTGLSKRIDKRLSASATDTLANFESSLKSNA